MDCYALAISLNVLGTVLSPSYHAAVFQKSCQTLVASIGDQPAFGLRIVNILPRRTLVFECAREQITIQYNFVKLESCDEPYYDTLEEIPDETNYTDVHDAR